MERLDRFRNVSASGSVTLRRIGATAVPLHLNPFLGDAAFHVLNRGRKLAGELKVTGNIT